MNLFEIFAYLKSEGRHRWQYDNRGPQYPTFNKDRSSRQKINKKTMDLNYTLDQVDLKDINRTLHPTAAAYTFPRTDHMLDHNTSLNNFKSTEIASSIFSNHNGMKPEINYKKKTGKLKFCGD